MSVRSSVTAKQENHICKAVEEQLIVLAMNRNVIGEKVSGISSS
jgi:hypothetical protein